MNLGSSLTSSSGSNVISDHLSKAIIAPIVVSTRTKVTSDNNVSFQSKPWDAIFSMALMSDAETLADTLASVLSYRRGIHLIARNEWVSSKFKPSSNIIDAAVSLYGQHNVSAIEEHALPTKIISECVKELESIVREVREKKEKRVIFISGAPGAGKTLVGLQLLFGTEKSVFVTGNAPLVDVLQLALKNSYKEKNAANQLNIPSG